MIIKQADNKQSDIDSLKNLLLHPNIDANKKKRIEEEVYKIYAGIRAENEAAYEMKVYYGESKNWAVIHDLRIEHNGLVAQIDHLLINRFLQMWVCESKHFSEGIEINEHGEFSAFSNNKPYGISSPIEQNNKHIVILKRLFESEVIKLPKRIGFTIKPDLKSVVLISNNARIIRPKNKIDGIDDIIKNEKFFKNLNKYMDENYTPLLLAKTISQETLETLANDIVNLHKPIEFNWAAKFGLSNSEPIKNVEQTLQETQKTAQSFFCFSCKKAVSNTVANFCWNNKLRFGGKVYCMECQKTKAQ
jgi:hypothetical protein